MANVKQIKAFDEVSKTILFTHLVTVDLYIKFSIMVINYVHDQDGDLDRLSDLYRFSEEAHREEHPILMKGAIELFRNESVTNTMLGNMIYDLYMVSTYYTEEAFELSQ